MNQLVPLSEDTERKARAERIRELLTDWSRQTLNIGKELKQTRDKFFPLTKTRGGKARIGWSKWLRHEFNMGERYATGLIRIFEKLGNKVSGTQIVDRFVLTMMARNSTTESARQEIIGRSKQGEHIGRDDAHKIIKKHHPKPSEASKLARETGKPVLASDGYIYFGATKEQATEIEKRRSVVFGVRRCVDTLAAMEITPQQFLEYALPHQLYQFDEGGRVDRAARWLTALSAAWDRKKKAS